MNLFKPNECVGRNPFFFFICDWDDSHHFLPHAISEQTRPLYSGFVVAEGLQAIEM